MGDILQQLTNAQRTERKLFAMLYDRDLDLGTDTEKLDSTMQG